MHSSETYQGFPGSSGDEDSVPSPGILNAAEHLSPSTTAAEPVL